MKQTIEIEVPNGKKAVWKNNKVVFEDIIPKLPKTWEEFCHFNKLNIEEEYVIKEDSSITLNLNLYGGISRRQDKDKNTLPSKLAAKQHLALMQLHQLRDCYRQGWLPDWDKDYCKYCIIKDNKIYKIINYHSLAHFLSFQTNEIAEEFLNNFRKLIEEVGDLI